MRPDVLNHDPPVPPSPPSEKRRAREPAPWLSHAHSALARATRRLRRGPKRVPPILSRRLRDVEGHCSGRPDERDLRDARDDFTAPAHPSSSLGPGSKTKPSLKSGSPLRPDVLNHDPSVPPSSPSEKGRAREPGAGSLALSRPLRPRSGHAALTARPQESTTHSLSTIKGR